MDKKIFINFRNTLFNANNTWKGTLFIGVVAACIFFIISSPFLTAQGLYYDELHQATASFAYKGITPKMFCSLAIRGIPILNMEYSGAIKTAVYGLYLRLFNAHFTVISWRLLGILFVTVGIVLFCIITHSALPLGSKLLFLFFILSDTTIVLATRHDWGPVALALFFRLLFIGIWVKGEAKERIHEFNTLLLGFLVSIAIFEKLSSAILLVLLLLIIFLSPKRHSLKHVLALIVGLGIGGLPLILVGINKLRYGSFISNETLEWVLRKNQISFSSFSHYISEYLSLGNGESIRGFILGTSGKYGDVEGILMGIVFLIIVISCIRYGNRNKEFRLSGIMLLCYLVVGMAFYLAPLSTYVHHWIIGTPFQYAAIILTFAGILRYKESHYFRKDFLLRTFMFFVSLLVILRVFTIISLEISLFKKDASLTWDPSLTKIGYFGAEHAMDSYFIVADWGVGTQIYCLSQGQSNIIDEFFMDYHGIEDLKQGINKSGKKIVYVVTKKPPEDVKPLNTKKIIEDVNRLPDWLPGWKEVAVESEIEGLRALQVRKFCYSPKESYHL